jgi:hypothetical protein
MQIEIVNLTLKFNLHGLSGPVENSDYSKAGKRLMDQMWAIVKTNSLKTTGINYWVYKDMGHMFTGVELLKPSEKLEPLSFEFTKYARYVHVGSYSLLKKVHSALRADLDKMGVKYGPYCVEKYGDWTEDESKLVTEVFYDLK